MTRIAVVGMACRYPDATSPRELWENAVAGRRAFRRMPDARMRLDDYWDADPAAPDRFYARNAAVLEGYEFDRMRYKVAGSTYRSTDLTHWLALDVAASALADAGFPMGEGLPHERTAVVVGNTLTGEFSRANQMRLRWPYVRRVVAAALGEQGWDEERLAGFLDRLEADYKRPFPAVDEDTLAGALSNTISGRICNHFDLKGGGYTVDGACSSSLLSVATASRALADGDVDVAIAGGVDLSIDPFEIIGFAKTGALATGEMRVYDRDSNGFWPGEGCGMVVLMREDQAREAGHRIYAVIAGWGVSSDGRGGITRPEVSGYQLALRRAYGRAGFTPDTVPLFEGHGTGTKIGDATELAALAQARRAANADAAPAAIGTVKAIIGHTKAAAGVAGLIKAVMAVHNEVLPPTVGCRHPHEIFAEERPALRALSRAEPWPADQPVRAGITAMGFGGVNTHVIVENPRPRRTRRLDTRTATLSASAQDAELLVLEGESVAALRARVAELAEFTGGVAYAQLADVAAALRASQGDLPYRAAVVVHSPEDAAQQLRRIGHTLDSGETTLLSAEGRAFLGHVGGPSRVGFLFPGQGSGTGTSGGALRRRFPELDEVYGAAALPAGGDLVATEVAQPRIATGSIAGLRVLSRLGIDATVAVGHSLGELSALHWAGVLDETALLRIAALRGKAMSQHSRTGTMAGLGAGPDAVDPLMRGLPVTISGYNGPGQTVVAGPVDAVDQVCRRAVESGIAAVPLAVSHAFHSPLVAPAAGVFATALAGESFAPLGRRVISTVTGELLDPDTDLSELLVRQITEPVLFSQAVALAAKEVELFVEVGPGRVLTRLVPAMTDVPAVHLDTDDESLTSLLRVVAAAYVRGAVGVPDALFDGRLVRPIALGAPADVLASPCEAAPEVTVAGGTGGAVAVPVAAPPTGTAPAAQPAPAPEPESSVDLLRRLTAARAELPLEMVRPDSLLLDDLHFSSITVGQVVDEATRLLGLPPARTPISFATASVRELAEALDELVATEGARGGPAEAAPVLGAGSWARAWRIDLDEEPPPAGEPERDGRWRVHTPPGDTPPGDAAAELRARLETAGVGSGVLVWLPEGSGDEGVQIALHAAQEVLGGTAGDRFVLVQHGPGAAGLAKTLRLEDPRIRVTIVHLPPGVEATDLVVREVAATTGHTEVYYDEHGVRRVPTLRALPVGDASGRPPLNRGDVLLVTGGGKGITAECALAMASDSGARLAILGRSEPSRDKELAGNLERMAHRGVTVRYLTADVTDPVQVQRAVEEVTRTFGPVTAVLHGAGSNEPAALSRLDAAAIGRTFAPKVDGLRTVLDAVGPQNLRLLVTLGSIIGRAGLRGEAHYAAANEHLAWLTQEVGEREPGCRSLCVEWSVWSGVGMGERLSVVEALSREGVSPITPDQGVEVLRRLLADPDTPPVVVVSGRTSGIDTIRYDPAELPLLRFVERPLVHYPGVELVTEVEIGAGTDPYLADHLLDGNLLFPAVFGMEAMAQVAVAVTGRTTAPVIEQAEFLRPIVVPPDGSSRIRIAAVVTGDDTVEAVIRGADTGFLVEHFQARLRFDAGPAPEGPPEPGPDVPPPVPLEPATDLYGGVLFQGARFQRLRRYHRAAARDVDVEVAAVPATWFAPYLPDRLVLGDPGVRDALMHGNQVCVPHATLLPAGIERVYPSGALGRDANLRYRAVERSQDGDTYVYDIVLRDGDRVVERWEGLRLRAVRKTDGAGPWVPPLLGPYLERSLGEVTGAAVAVAVEPDDAGNGAGDEAGYRERRRSATARAVSRAAGEPTLVRYRPDGRPEIDGDREVSVAHGPGVTLCAIGAGPVACDLEPVRHRPAAQWRDLLGPNAEAAAAQEGTDPDLAATRVWVAVECLQKAGQPITAPIAITPVDRPGWTVFASGTLRVATFATTLRGAAGQVVVGLLTGGSRAR